MRDGEKCCEHCAELKDSEALKKVIEYAIDATPRSDYLRLGVQQLSESLHKKKGDQRDDARLAALNAHCKIVSLRGVADTASKLVIALHTKNFHRVGPFFRASYVARSQSSISCGPFRASRYPPPPMPPPAVVPRLALVTMCHENPCLMGRQLAGSQDRKQPGQRSVLARRVPARGHAASGRMIPMLEAPPLPSLLYIYMSVVCNKGKGHYLWASGGPHNPFCMHGY